MEEGGEGKGYLQAGGKARRCQTCCCVSAVLRELQVRADEEAGAAGQDLKQTAFLFLAGLRGCDKGPCCALTAPGKPRVRRCRWSFAFLLSAVASSLHFPVAVLFTLLARRRVRTSSREGQKQAGVRGPLAPGWKHGLLTGQLARFALLSTSTLLLCGEIYITDYDVLRYSH